VLGLCGEHVEERRARLHDGRDARLGGRLHGGARLVVARDGGEGAHARGEVEKVAGRGLGLVALGRHVGQPDELIRFRKGYRVEQHAVDHREHGTRQTDPQREEEDGGDRETR
jgi:hypothetical protein